MRVYNIQNLSALVFLNSTIHYNFATSFISWYLWNIEPITVADREPTLETVHVYEPLLHVFISFKTGSGYNSHVYDLFSVWRLLVCVWGLKYQ